MATIAAAGGAADPDAVASRLIDEFGSLAAALGGRRRRQFQAVGGDRGVMTALAFVQAAIEHAQGLRLTEQPLVADTAALVQLLHTKMDALTIEAVWLIHFNSRGRLIRAEPIGEGTTYEAPVYVREVMHRALDLGSTTIILAHNHPGGDPKPSSGDIALTRAIMNAAKPLGVEVFDHLVIGRYGHASIRQLGLMPTINTHWST